MLKIDLSKKVAVVTGATGELGPSIARTLAACGADVAIHYLNNKAKAEQLKTDLSKHRTRLMTVQADITSLDSVLAMRDQVAAELGDPDIIVNNAITPIAWQKVLELKAENFDAMFRSCTLQNVFMAKAFVPAMIRKRYGRIIATNTECAMQNGPNMGAYTSGKRGMDGVLRVLAKEIGEYRITVNQVAPGWTITDSARRDHTEKQADYEKNVPLHRRGEDQEIANVVAFLASDLASFITGAYIPVCGGAVMPAI